MPGWLSGGRATSAEDGRVVSPHDCEVGEAFVPPLECSHARDPAASPRFCRRGRVVAGRVGLSQLRMEGILFGLFDAPETRCGKLSELDKSHGDAVCLHDAAPHPSHLGNAGTALPTQAVAPSGAGGSALLARVRRVPGRIGCRPGHRRASRRPRAAPSPRSPARSPPARRPYRFRVLLHRPLVRALERQAPHRFRLPIPGSVSRTQSCFAIRSPTRLRVHRCPELPSSQGG